MNSRNNLFQSLAIMVVVSTAAVMAATGQEKGALERILSNEPLTSAEALELLKEVANSEPDQRQLDVQSLLDLTDITSYKCDPITSIMEAYSHLEGSLGPYLSEYYWKQAELCNEMFDARLMVEVSRMDGQLRSDIESLVDGLNLPQDHSPFDDVPRKNIYQAIIQFILKEKRKPDGERRYYEQTVFYDMKHVIADDCKRAKQAIGDIVNTRYQVIRDNLTTGEQKWITASNMCDQLIRKPSDIWVWASINYRKSTSSSV